MKAKTLSVRLNSFDAGVLQYICEKYKVSEADAIRKAIELLKSWDLDQCNENLKKHGTTRPINYERGIEWWFI